MKPSLKQNQKSSTQGSNTHTALLEADSYSGLVVCFFVTRFFFNLPLFLRVFRSRRGFSLPLNTHQPATVYSSSRSFIFKHTTGSVGPTHPEKKKSIQSGACRFPPVAPPPSQHRHSDWFKLLTPQDLVSIQGYAGHMDTKGAGVAVSARAHCPSLLHPRAYTSQICRLEGGGGLLSDKLQSPDS